MSTNIAVKGARVNNLKNIDLEIPGNKFIVITGLSGSGKSSLAFDTLYAEGQRRYVESLSAYARQFMGKLSKPECDWIKGLPPAIAIEQKVISRNPRSTVGTSTEIYDYLRLLFARIGHTISPISGVEVKKHACEDVLQCALGYAPGTRMAIVAPICLPAGRDLRAQLDIFLKEGYSRVVKDDKILNIEDMLQQPDLPSSSHGYSLLIDRFALSDDKDAVSRMSESIETAFFEGHKMCALLAWDDRHMMHRHDFSTNFEADGIVFMEPSEQLFNFNTPYGACPTCEGFGRIIGIDEKLVVPNPSLSVYEDAVVCWRGEKMSEWKRELIHLAPHINFPIHRPYADLTEAEKKLLWEGNSKWAGINGFFRWVERQQAKIQYRVMLARFRGKTICPDCNGARLRKEADYVKINDKSISDIVAMPVSDLTGWFGQLQLPEQEAAIAKRILTEINNRLDFLMQVGLGYLTLNRLSNTLSGGESQRINLATSLGSSLVGSLYILDEPSIGLHPRDTHRLIQVLRQLQQIGNTVIVVEHDEEVMRAADWIIDVGPKAGRLGGEIVYQGPPSGTSEPDTSDLPTVTNNHADESYTLKYLNGQLQIPVPKHRRKWSQYIQVNGAREHNLKNIDVRFPLKVMTVVTGVSGSGKSTLVRDILYKAMRRHIGEAGDAPGAFKGLSGDTHCILAVEFVDQNPIGTSSRSNPATYLKAYDEIRKLFSDQQAAKQMNFTPAFFSTNTEGGRCEECKGTGEITIEMQFMADIHLTCEACHGKRFKPDVLEVRYRDKNIDDVLNMTVNQAIEFFGEDQAAQPQRVVKRLLPLQQVGLGYIKLGQSSSTLSGGENQRVKLAYFLSQDKPQPSMFIFDEPTVGLHFYDINVLMESFDRLISQGHTIIIIEHNLDVIKCADHVIDIGPEGGEAGGYIVAVGTPEDIMACPRSHTGQFLKALNKQATEQALNESPNINFC